MKKKNDLTAKVGDNMARGAQGNGTIRQRKDGRWEGNRYKNQYTAKHKPK